MNEYVVSLESVRQADALRVGGTVLDSGGVGQHHAITAREYGVPAVLGTGNATRRIPDGAWVTVDGTTGVVEIDE